MTFKYTYDDLLYHYVGGLGKWHILQFCLLLLQMSAASFPFFIYMYSAFAPPHRCFVPVCDTFPDNSTYQEPWTRYAIPPGEEHVDGGEKLSQCSMYALKGGAKGCLPESFDNTTTQPCEEYIYDRSIFEETLTTELDLVCNDEYKVHFIGTVMMIGLLVGSLLGGPLSDRAGRKWTLTLALAIIGPLVIIEGFVVNYIAFLAFRFVIWASCCIMWLASNALLVELFSKNHRKKAFFINNLGLPIYCCIMVGIVYLERDWSYMHLWIGIIGCCILPIIMFHLKESVRWLISNEKLEEAETIIVSAAKTNNHKLTDDEIQELRHMMENMAEENKDTSSGFTVVFEMFKGKLLPRTVILLSLWITTVLSYYALTMSATSLAGNIFLNFILSLLADIPSGIFFYFFADRLGRRYTIVFSHSILGICCIVMAFLPTNWSKFTLAMFLTGKFASSLSMNILWLYTAELFPTNLRAQATGLCSMVARIFGMAAPFIAQLNKIWAPLPMLVLGVPALLCGWLAVKLPETAGKDLTENKDVKKEGKQLES